MINKIKTKNVPTSYFTGSAHFNRSMRNYANKIGWSLSDKGLELVARNGKGKKCVKIPLGKHVECKSEEDIFNALGLEYRKPNERNCFDNHWEYAGIEDFEEESVGR